MSIFIPNDNTALIYTPIIGYSALQPMTVMCWAYLSGTTPVNWRDFVSLDPNIYLQTMNDGISIDFGTLTTDNVGQVLQANTWYHFAQVVVPTTTTSRQIYGYVNGKLNVNITDTSTFSTYTYITIGNSTQTVPGPYPLNGNVRDVRAWTRALNATDIVQEYNSGVVVNPEGLFSWTTFDDHIYEDKSGHGRNWTTSGSISIQAGPLRPFPKSNTMRWI
jgi:hypothetical protein